MSEPFGRIKREIDKLGGQPYIEGTDVTVSQILALTLVGKSLQEIIDQLPMLSVDDIHQAMGFAINDMAKAISYWRHDGMTPLTQIKGYSEILVGKTEFDDLHTISDQQKQQWMSIIHSSSQRGIARWQQMTQWMSKRYRLESDNQFEVIQLDKFVIDMVSTAQNCEPLLNIQITPYNNNIQIKVHPDTALILGQLLSYAKNTFDPDVIIKLDNSQNNLAISIQRDLTYPDDDIQKLISTPYNPIATALTFFFQVGQPFNISHRSHSIIFATEITIWKNQSK